MVKDDLSIEEEMIEVDFGKINEVRYDNTSEIIARSFNASSAKCVGANNLWDMLFIYHARRS